VAHNTVENEAPMINWNEQIDKITQEFISYFSELNAAQMNWKPNSDTWSIAQNIDHLMVINNSYFPIIESLQRGNYKTLFLSKIGFAVSFFGNIILKAVQPDRKKKIKTFSIWEPSKSEIPDVILTTFKNHQAELKLLIENSKELLEKGAVISSPANKHIVYTLEKAFEIIITHEQRHFEQAKEVLALLKK
jgi:hypothetical protein